jgi:hypothetical protein
MIERARESRKELVTDPKGASLEKQRQLLLEQFSMAILSIPISFVSPFSSLRLWEEAPIDLFFFFARFQVTLDNLVNADGGGGETTADAPTTGLQRPHDP